MPDSWELLNDKQLVWRCRRGIRELDVLFGRFLQSEYAGLQQTQQVAFQRLLEVQDPVIMDWLFAKSVCQDSEIQAIVIRLQRLSGL